MLLTIDAFRRNVSMGDVGNSSKLRAVLIVLVAFECIVLMLAGVLGSISSLVILLFILLVVVLPTLVPLLVVGVRTFR